MRVRVSRLVAFWWRDGQLVCDDPVRHRQLALTPEAERRLRSHATWTELAGDDALAHRLLEAHILVAEGSPEHLLEERLGAWRAIGPAATHYHLASRTQAGDEFRTAAQDAAALRAKAEQTPQPLPIKEYGEPRVPLPDGGLAGTPFAAVLAGRRSTRWFDAAPVRLADLATLLRWTAGVRYEVDVPGLGPTMLKTTPSGGSRHPVEVYPVIRAVDGLAPGIYHYAARAHALSCLAPGAVPDETLRAWCGGQPHAATAACLLLYTAVPERTAWKYASSRAYRALLLDLGHLSQTVYLVATALGLGAFFTAATRDALVEDALGICWTDEILLGVTGIGVPHPRELERQQAMRAGDGAGFSFPPDAWHGFGE